MSTHPIVIIGAGPQGLAAAAHLAERAQEVIVLEQGDSAGAAVQEWGHVRLFSAWPELVDAAAARLLAGTGWMAPTSGYPTGAEWANAYLVPLADALGDRVRRGMTVTGVTRLGRDKVIASRDDVPFVVRATDAEGRETRLLARAVIDASGTWSTPNPAGADGLAAAGELDASALIDARIPDDVASLAGRHVVVIGGGHSAVHAVLRLAELASSAPDTRISWVLRRGTATGSFGGGADDGLPERAALGTRARAAVDAGLVELVTGFRVSAFERRQGALRIHADDGQVLDGVDHVFALTGFRPDFRMLREVRIDIDPALESVAGIAEEIDPNIHSCGTVAATGARQLRHPERDLYIVGAKSYGRAPTFLALTGYEQVRSVAADLAGDREAAERNDLILPETGVCGGSGGFDSGSCCAAPVPVVTSGARPLLGMLS